MKIASIIIFIAVLLFIQIGILTQIEILGVYPNLILLSVLSLVIVRGWRKSFGWIVFSGLFLDLYSLQNIVGTAVLAIIMSSALISFLIQRFFRKTNSISLLVAFFFSIVFYEILLIIFLRIFGIDPNFSLASFSIKIVYNIVFALPIFHLIKFYVGKFWKI